MTEELPPYLFPIQVFVSEIQIPDGLSLKVLNLLKPIVFDFNRTLLISTAKIENISYSFVGRSERFIDIKTLITGKFSNAAEDANSMIKAKASLSLILLNDHKSALTAKSDSELLGALIDKLKSAPKGIFFTELYENGFLAAGSLLGKTSELV